MEADGRLARHWRACLLVLVTAIALLVVATNRFHRPTDFATFWNTGLIFRTGEPLYAPRSTFLPYYYPPAAAALFVPLTIVSLPVSQAIFNAGSFLALLASLWMLRSMLLSDDSHRRLAFESLAVAAIVCLPFALNTLHEVQINIFILFLILASFASLANGRRVAAGGWIALASLIKVVPAALVVWYLLRRQTRAAFVALSVIAVVSIGAIGIRGSERGRADYREFVNDIVVPSQSASYRDSQFNYSIDGPVWHLAKSKATAVLLALKKVVAGGLLALAWRLRGQPVVLEEVSLLLVVVLLFSPETAESHLVWLLPVLVTVWMRVFQGKGGSRAVPLIAVSLMLLLVQMSIVGVKAWGLLADARLWTICLGVLLLLAAHDAFSRAGDVEIARPPARMEA